MLSLFSVSCEKVRGEFSGYLDGAVSGRTMQVIASHLRTCAGCTKEFAEWQATQRAVAELGSLKAPEDLALRLRVAISRESARQASRWTDRFELQWKNVIGPLALNVAAGFVGTVLLVGGIVTMLSVVPEAALADDEPLGAMTSPHYLYSAANVGAIQTAENTMIVVAVDVDNRGEVYDYKILSGPIDESTRRQVEQHLLVSVFAPARVFDTPVQGRALVTFSGISVKG